MEEIKANNKSHRKHPLDTANAFSKLIFWWLLPLFKKGYKTQLTEDDIYENRKCLDSGVLGDRLERNWNKQLSKNKTPSLTKTLIHTFYWEYIILITLYLITELIRIAQPFLITQLIRVYDTNRANTNKEETYYYATLLVLCSFVYCNTVHNFYLLLTQLSIKIRVSCCSLIYRKTLRLSTAALAETTIGEMVNLLSNDVGRFDLAIFYLHYLFMGPIVIVIFMYLLYVDVGGTALFGFTIFLVFIPLQVWTTKKTSQYRFSTAAKTDERVRLMNEIVTGIQVIKMYTWEYPFSKLIEFVRKEEMKYIGLNARIKSIVSSSAIFLNRSSLAISILLYVLTGNTLTASYAYALTSYYRLMDSMTYLIPLSFRQTAELYTSLKRIQNFLLYSEIEMDQKHLYDKIELDNTMLKSNSEVRLVGPDASITIQAASAKWLKYLPGNNLESINMDITSGNAVAVIGPVGSGKTSLLHIILKELELQSGSVNVQGVISYACQEPWLFGGSIRQNILFGQTFDLEKYNEVVRVCALTRDFTSWPHGDRTLSGERGVILSGGQKARINLARAIYKEADIYLLDDPLSAVDSHVGKQLFEDCICGYLAKKCVVLVTHQLQYLKNVKHIYVMNKGRIEVEGSYSFLKASDSPYGQLLIDMKDDTEDVTIRSKMISVNEEQQQQEKHEIQELKKEERATGNIAGRVYWNFVRAGGHLFKAIFILLAFILGQVLYSSSEYFVTIWVNIQQWHSEGMDLQEIFTQVPSTRAIEIISNTTAQFVSNFSSIEAALPINITLPPPEDIVITSFQNWWLNTIFNDCVTLWYGLLIMGTILIALIARFAFYGWCLRVSTKMHNQMFANIVYSPMIFFNLNPSGRILNRFSKDIGTVDELLPTALSETIQIVLRVAAAVVLIGSLTVWVVIPTVAMAAVFHFLRLVYMATSRDIKRIDSVSRSPVFTHLSASLQGLITIRAFKAQDTLKKEFDNYQNRNTSPCFLYAAATRTLGYWSDVCCTAYLAAVIVVMLFVKSEQFGGNMGLALTQAISLMTLIQYGMRQWSEFENQMTSVERMQEYIDLVKEKDEPINGPTETWPQNGQIKFDNISLRYAAGDPFVLKNLNFVIKPLEKIGIVGRTGAGKSSLIQALFRLADTDGSIFIDGINTKTIALKDLRSKISIIPQEPVLFSGTIKRNLDPFDEYPDEKLWNVLEEVNLKQAIEDLPAGIDNKMTEGGSNFSVGQKQLFCLARAILKNNKILVLDEATANVDLQTDNLIQTTIRNKFTRCTVLTIAHRLHTIMDSDRVLVMDAGQAVEFDHPYNLLQNPESVFSSLVRETGIGTTLRSIVEETKDSSDLENS